MAKEYTERMELPTYTSGTDLHPTREDFNERMELIDQLTAIIHQGPHSDRPQPGVQGRLWFSLDRRELYMDTGNEWEQIARIGNGGAGKSLKIGGDGEEGISIRAARADHTHPLPLATASEPGAQSAAHKQMLDDATSSASGSGGKLVRRDSQGTFGIPTPQFGSNPTNKNYVDDLHAVTVQDKGSLGTTNLNSVTDIGEYFQATTSTATSARNYPTPSSGSLSVRPIGSSSKVQIYTTWGTPQAQFIRRRDSSNTWSDWVELATTALATSSSPGLMPAADKSLLDGASSQIGSGSNLVRRNSDGRYNAADPSADSQVANKRYVDTLHAETLARRTDSLNSLGDMDNLLESGVYYLQSSQVSSTANTPVNVANGATILVYRNAAASGRVQEFIFSHGSAARNRRFMRTQEAGGWSEWVEWANRQHVDEAVAAVQTVLDNYLNGVPIGSANLNTFTTPGRYRAAASDAISGRNYPPIGAENNEGLLEVMRHISNAVMQRYTIASGAHRMWIRRQFTTGSWSEWNRVGEGI